jgi:DNA replication and repair protein RecF
VWTADFCSVSEELVVHRERLLKDLSPLVEKYYHELAHDSVPVGVDYDRSWTGSLIDAVRAAFDDDRFRGHTTRGPQRDDIALTLNGRDTRRQASQGEQRTLALALRLAGHELVQQMRGVDPLLLLDDVFSELDPLRSNRLLHLLPSGQTLVTTASPLPEGMNPAVVIDLARILA